MADLPLHRGRLAVVWHSGQTTAKPSGLVFADLSGFRGCPSQMVTRSRLDLEFTNLTNGSNGEENFLGNRDDPLERAVTRPSLTAENDLLFLAALCGMSVFAAAVIVTEDIGHIELWALGGIWALASGLGAFAGWGIFRLLGFHRRSAKLSTVVLGTLLAFAAIWGVQNMSAHVLASPWERYMADLGGQGRCLSPTPYGADQAEVVSGGNIRGLEVRPLRQALPVLRLASHGVTHHLTPADSVSARILHSYRCR